MDYESTALTAELRALRSPGLDCSGKNTALSGQISLQASPRGSFVIGKKQQILGGSVRTLSRLTTVVGTVSLLFAGYVLLNALPDLGRYIRISRM